MDRAERTTQGGDPNFQFELWTGIARVDRFVGTMREAVDEAVAQATSLGRPVNVVSGAVVLHRAVPDRPGESS